MHDFLDDLHRRLEAARAEQAELSEYIRSLESLIPLEKKRRQRVTVPAIEARRVPRPKRNRTRQRKGQPSPVKQFLTATMSNNQLWALDRLKLAAAEHGLDFGGKSPGHVLHFALVALKNSGQAQYDPDMQGWRLSGPRGNADARNRTGE